MVQHNLKICILSILYIETETGYNNFTLDKNERIRLIADVMGGLTSVSCKLWKKRNVRILFLGLDAAGKTTILYQLKLGEVVTTIPTIGFNVESIEHENVNFTAWDVGVRDKMRPLLRHYYASTEALVFVIDSRDRERYREALEMLQETLSDDELKDVPILILANKQDLNGIMSREEIISDLMTNKCLADRKWEVFAVSGILGEGLRDGLDWLTSVLMNTLPKREDSDQERKNDTDASVKDVSKLSYYDKMISALKNLFV